MNPESQRRVSTIESWFRENEDGEFALRPYDQEPIRGGDHCHAHTIIYTTKPRCLACVNGIWDLPRSVATVGQYGLPLTSDLEFLVGSSESCNRIFIGDADPPDLLIYSWLREFVSITWYGVSDRFLEHHGNLENKRIWISLSNAETDAVAVLADICPDYQDLLGEYCASLLKRRFKIELEGAIINRGPTANDIPGLEQNFGTPLP